MSIVHCTHPGLLGDRDASVRHESSWRLDGREFYINPHQIEYIELNPDTTLIMLSGKRLIVREDYQTVLERIIDYRREIGVFKNEE